VAGECGANVRFGGRGLTFEQIDQRHFDAGGAEPALQRMMRAQRLLQWVQGLSGGRQPLNRIDDAAVGLYGQHQTGTDAVAVDQNRAGAAMALLASDMGSGMAEMVAQQVCEGFPGLNRNV